MNPFGGSVKPRLTMREAERMLSNGFTHLIFYPATNGYSAAPSELEAKKHVEQLAKYGGHAAWCSQYVIFPLADVVRYKPAFLAK